MIDASRRFAVQARLESFQCDHYGSERPIGVGHLILAMLALAGCVALPALVHGAGGARRAVGCATAPATPRRHTASKCSAHAHRIARRGAAGARKRQADNRPTTPTRERSAAHRGRCQHHVQRTSPRTCIEQIRTSNRITEIRVTPALTGRTYTITNREGRQPTSATDTSSSLSVPKFFTFECGRPEERPAAALPPPPLPPLRARSSARSRWPFSPRSLAPKPRAS